MKTLSSGPHFFRKVTQILALTPLLLLISATQVAYAGSASWDIEPSGEDWNTAANWTPETVPDGSEDVATFSISNQPHIEISSSVEISELVFAPGASAFTIDLPFQEGITFVGPGVTNNSGIEQHINSFVRARFPGFLSFQNAASAGKKVTYNTYGAFPYPAMAFFDSSTAGRCRIINNGSSSHNQGGGYVYFSDDSSAGEATILNDGGLISGAEGGTVEFFTDGATAGNARIMVRGGKVSGALGGSIKFANFSHAGDSTLIASGGVAGAESGIINFFSAATGDRARVALRDGGVLSIYSTTVDLTIGSLEGNGGVVLGSHALIIGSNDLSTSFRGVIQGPGGLTKSGQGSLTLSGASTYSGTTTVESGTLVVTNRSGSATGTGSVQVNGGILGGTGIMAGALTIGDGLGTNAVLSPGLNAVVGTLSTSQSLSFKADASYDFTLDSDAMTSGQTIAQGITINAASFSPSDRGSGALPVGTTFIALNNTSATPISGTFSDLPDGGSIVIGANTFVANYEGGDGNDLALAVVP